MSDMKEMIIDSTTKIMESYSTKEVVNDAENGKWASQLWNSLNQLGMLTVAVPEELGGNGGDFDDALSILSIAGKYSAPIPLAETYMVNWILAEFGIKVKNEIMTLSCDHQQELFQFHRESDCWIVNGKATNVPWGRNSESILVMGETKDEVILSLIKLEKAKIIQGKNMAGEPRDQVIFNHVPVSDCIIIPIERLEIENKIKYIGALTRIVMMAGGLEKVLELVINHSKERSQFGRPLYKFQAIQQHISNLAGETAAAQTAANYAVSQFGKSSYIKEIALAKIRVNEAVGKANRVAHQVLAAIGFTHEHILHHSTRRLWSWRDEFGTETDWENVITKELLKLEKNGLWSMITGIESLKREEMK